MTTASWCSTASRTLPSPSTALWRHLSRNLADISQSMQFDNANSTTNCSPDAPGVPNSLTAAGTQSPGYYFMLGITPLADDSRYDLQTASLQTTSGTFVAPSNDSLEAATDLLQPDTTTGTWPIPYDQFENERGAGAYPGTMVVYAAIPTSGLPAQAAADYANILTFAAGPGQTPGDGIGQLPPGYLPLTAADGLGGLAAYTTRGGDGRCRPERPDSLHDERVGWIRQLRVLRLRPGWRGRQSA